jgi:hypothetical protein
VSAAADYAAFKVRRILAAIHMSALIQQKVSDSSVFALPLVPRTRARAYMEKA